MSPTWCSRSRRIGGGAISSSSCRAMPSSWHTRSTTPTACCCSRSSSSSIRAALPAQARGAVGAHRPAAAIGRGDHAARAAPGAAEPDRGRQLRAARCRAGAGRPGGCRRRRADDRRRRSQRCRLVAHQPPVPTHQPPARSAGRPRHVQQLSRRLAAAALAARPCLRQQRLPASRDATTAGVRLGSLSNPDPDRPRASRRRGEPSRPSPTPTTMPRPTASSSRSASIRPGPQAAEPYGTSPTWSAT